MKKIEEYYLFVINAFLIAGLIAIGFWLQQNNGASMAVAPASTATATAPAVNAQPGNATGIATPAPASASAASATTGTVLPPPVIRTPGENESGGGYRDE